MMVGESTVEKGSGYGRQLVLNGLVGGLIGAGLEGGLWGLASGAGLGMLFAETRALRRQLDRLAVTNPEPRPTLEARDLPASAAGSALDAPAAAPPSRPSAADTSKVQEWTPRDRPRSRPVADSGRGFMERWTESISGILFGGNAVVRVGLLVLFVGLTLLAKYAVDNALFPVEARLAAAAMVGLGLVAFGYHERVARPGFGMSLQGGGFAVLYLVTFFAFRVYGLIGAGAAFTLFAGLAFSTAALAAHQRSQPLLVIGSLGGFAAPVLAATGSNEHIALFSYYLLLTLSIAGVAWWRSWRWPAWVAFVCVYGIATVWGVLTYEPERFATTEPFLLAFMVLFTGIAVMHAWRRPPELRGLIDGTLVFGTPFISILLQAALVQDFDFGLARSAVGFSIFYAAVAFGLRRFGPKELGALIEAFGALAVGFATMAIPFAFEEGLTTAIAWSLEGAGLYWVGARQDRRLARSAGLLLQPLAGIACVLGLALDPLDSSEFVPLANGRALSFLALAGAAFFIAHRADVQDHSGRTSSSKIGLGLGFWGLGWWSVGVMAEIEQFVSPEFRLAAALGVTAASASAIEWTASALAWMPGRRLALVALPAAGVLLIAARSDNPQLLANGGVLAWPLVFGVFAMLWARQRAQPSFWLEVFRAGAFWLLALFTALAALGIVDVELALHGDWLGAAFGVGLATVLGFGLWLARPEAGIFARPVESVGDGSGGSDPIAPPFLELGLGPIALVGLGTIFHLQFWAEGDALPLRHLPILNPTDGTVLLLGGAIGLWARRAAETLGSDWARRFWTAFLVVAVGVGFLSINGSIARAVHQWTGVPLALGWLWDSSAFHMTISIVWTLLGCGAMWRASRKGWRPLWMAAALLLSVVVLKLFLIDLAQLSTVTRIGTFLAVGMLLLVLGYVSPVPPADEDREAS